jgi:hypothetical protein
MAGDYAKDVVAGWRNNTCFPIANIKVMAMTFQPGQSGNPAGKKPGTKNRKTLLLQELEKDGSALAAAIKAAALSGDASAMSLWLTRLEPALRSRSETVEIELDVDASSEDQIKTIMRAIVAGAISVETGSMLINNIEKLANIRAAQGSDDKGQALVQAFRDMATKLPV